MVVFGRMIEGFFSIRMFHSESLPLFISPWQQILFLFAILIFLYICFLSFTVFPPGLVLFAFFDLFIPGNRAILDFLGELYIYFLLFFFLLF